MHGASVHSSPGFVLLTADQGSPQLQLAKVDSLGSFLARLAPGSLKSAIHGQLNYILVRIKTGLPWGASLDRAIEHPCGAWW